MSDLAIAADFWKRLGVKTGDRRTGATPSWFIDEVAFAGRENLDAEHVGSYDEKEDSGAAEELELLERLGLAPDSSIVEFGPGTGQLTVEAAARCRRVVAVDPSALMLDRLRAKLAERDLENVKLVNAGFLTYQYSGEPVGFVYSRLALHHIPDFWKAIALARMRGALRPGGVLRLVDVVFDFEPAEAEGRLESWCKRYEGGGEGEWTRADVEEHIRDEHSTFTWILEPMFERCGFRIETAEKADDGIFAGYVLSAV